ncbi:MAG: VOC family protein [Pseudomonadota bacterium]
MRTLPRVNPPIWAAVAALLAVTAAPAAGDSHTQAKRDDMTQRHVALGIGGVFFRSEDPGALAAWYEEHLGINPVPTSYEDQPWVQEAGPTIIAPFPADQNGMIPEGKSWLLNLRVADLDAIAAQLKADGVAVEIDPTQYPNGRFAMLADPEGNPIQLWEPKAPE